MALVVAEGTGERAFHESSAVYRFEFTPSAKTSRRGVGVETVRERLLSQETGPGISSEHLEAIFEPFTQVDQVGARF